MPIIKAADTTMTGSSIELVFVVDFMVMVGVVVIIVGIAVDE